MFTFTETTRSDLRQVETATSGSSNVDLRLDHRRSASITRRRTWRNFDFDNFSNDLCQSELLCDPPTDASSLVNCYNKTFQTHLDKHAPFVDIKPRADTNAPWYDRQCQQAKAATRRRRLERLYGRDKTDCSREAWRRQSGILRQTLR